jgi:hypothetical protein
MRSLSPFIIFLVLTLIHEGFGGSEHKYGKGLNVLKMESDKLYYDSKVINDLFMHPEVKNRKAVIISIVGVFRKGKSFFLDYCLRYLYTNVRLKKSESRYEIKLIFFAV